VRRVTITTLTTACDAATAYARVSQFARYPDLTETVREVVVHQPGPDGSVVSEWTVRFRNGLLRWTERDVFDHDRMSVSFVQLTGDFETFEGTWLVERAGVGARVTFAAVFDLGIPTLAAILDPVAESTLRSNVLHILRGLLGEIRELTAPDSVTAA
jgi:ribosome-associated toxin RatA of RatAB toxin-antitoxin module